MVVESRVGFHYSNVKTCGAAKFSVAVIRETDSSVLPEERAA